MTPFDIFSPLDRQRVPVLANEIAVHCVDLCAEVRALADLHGPIPVLLRHLKPNRFADFLFDGRLRIGADHAAALEVLELDWVQGQMFFDGSDTIPVSELVEMGFDPAAYLRPFPPGRPPGGGFHEANREIEEYLYYVFSREVMNYSDVCQRLRDLGARYHFVPGSPKWEPPVLVIDDPALAALIKLEYCQ